MREIFRPWPTDDYYAAWAPTRLFGNAERPSLGEIAETYEEVTDLIHRTELAEPDYHTEHPVRDIAFFAMIQAHGLKWVGRRESPLFSTYRVGVPDIPNEEPPYVAADSGRP